MSQSKGEVSVKYARMPPAKTLGEKHERDISRCWDMLDYLESVHTFRPIKWVEGMKKYWESKLRKLTDNPPLYPGHKL